MKWVYDDGGRNAAGFRGKAGDCVARSIAIATRLPYRQVYALLKEQAGRKCFALFCEECPAASGRHLAAVPTGTMMMSRLP